LAAEGLVAGVFLTEAFFGVAALAIGVFFLAEAFVSTFLAEALAADFLAGAAGAAIAAAGTVTAFFFSPPLAAMDFLPDFFPSAGIVMAPVAGAIVAWITFCAGLFLPASFSSAAAAFYAATSFALCSL
jgi:hypothetical protein